MKSIVAILFASFALVACGKKEEAPAAPAAAPVVVPAPAAAPASGPAKTEEVKK